MADHENEHEHEHEEEQEEPEEGTFMIPCFTCLNALRIAWESRPELSDVEPPPFDDITFTDNVAECPRPDCLGRMGSLAASTRNFIKARWTMKHKYRREDIEALNTATSICQECMGLATQLPKELEQIGKTDRARHLVPRLRRIKVTKEKDACGLTSCFSRDEKYELQLAPSEKALQMSPVCGPCQQHYRAMAKWFRQQDRKEIDPLTVPHFQAYNYLRKTSDPALCINIECLSRRENEPHEEQHSCSGGDPNVCTCENGRHTQILSDIRKIETLHKKLKVQYGVTQHLRKETGIAKPVDMSVPCVNTRIELEELSQLVNELKFGEDTIQTKKGRPLCPVPEKEYCCHHKKIRAFMPGNCDCVAAACSCTCCIRRHVQHCVEDYEDAVSRVSVGITKLTAMSRSAGDDESAFTTNESRDGGCAMPGVRKGRHVQKYARAQKDAHNSKK